MSNAIEITPDQTLAELAVTRAGASRVFHRHGLDFCCGGQIALSDACQRHSLDPQQMITEIVKEERADDTFERWDEQALDLLVDHILTRFHDAHRQELPRLLEMARKVESVHADKASCPKGLAAFLEHVAGELEQHMQKEEQILFPMIKAGRGAMAAMPVQVMEQEHRDHGKNLAKLRSLAHDYQPPAEACNTWRALYLGLDELEAEVMQHIHLENNILFPRALRS